MGLEQTSELLNSDADFAVFFGRLLCQTNGGSTTAAACLEAFYEPTDEELDALCIPASEYSKYQKCTEQSILLSPIAYSVIGKKGFKLKKK